MTDRTPETEGTVCPFCAVGCRLEGDGERVVGRAGPANPNGRLCRTGLRAFDAVDDSDRLTDPLIRTDGDLVRTTWEAAIDRVIQSFEAVLDEHGPDALAFLGAPRCTNEENYLLQKLARTLGTNNVDNRARLCHAETADALADRLGWPATTNTLADLERADAILVVGADPAERQPVAFDSSVRPAVNAGATLVHVDPRRNETTRLADRHLAPLPGTDALVVGLLCALVVEAGGVDDRFVRDRTTGFERYRSGLDDVDPTEGAARADVDLDVLREVARTLGDADRVAVLTGTGADEAATADALLNLLLLTGNLGRPGTGLHVLRGLSNEQGATDAGCVPHRLPGHRPVSDAAARERVAKVWGVEPPSAPGRDERELLATFGEDVRGALVVGENPAISKHDPEWIDRRLDALDVLVVDELFESETTRHADVVLPAAAGVEKGGTVTNLDRQIQRLRPLAEPPGNARADFDVLRRIGRSLVPDAFDYEGPADAFEELTRVAPPYAGVSYADLAERSRRWPASEGGPDASSGILYRHAFATVDGRAPFVPMDHSIDDRDDGGFDLVVEDRTGAFAPEERPVSDHVVAVHPNDAAGLGVADGSGVVVSNDVASVEVSTRVTASVRPGVVHLHAADADPLLRGGRLRVTLEPAGDDRTG